jgi:hypothetical protein
MANRSKEGRGDLMAATEGIDFQALLSEIMGSMGEEGVSDEEINEALQEEEDRIRAIIKALRPESYGPTVCLQRFDDAGPVVAELAMKDYESEKYKAMAMVAEQAAKGPGVFSAAFSAQAYLWREKNPGDTQKYAAAGLTKPSQMPDRFEGIVIAVMTYDGRTAGSAFRIERGRGLRGRKGRIIGMAADEEIRPDSMVKSGLLNAFWRRYYALKIAADRPQVGQA